jgi:hypothetical protein
MNPAETRALTPFVVGVARSGTTLLRLMLDAHPELAIPHETHFIPAALREPDASRESFFRFLTTFPTWKDLNTPAERFEEELRRVEPFNVPDGLRAFYRLYTEAHGKQRWGDKSPPYNLHIRTIHEALPEARFIHILRDGRDVAVSLRPLWFSPGESMEELAAHWVQRITETRRQGQGMPFYLEVRYEDLIAHPVRELQRICRFIDLPYAPEMLAYHQTARLRLAEVETHRDPDGRVVITKEERLHNHRFTSQPPEPSRIGRWRTEMTREMLAAYEEIAGEMLEDLGYKRGYRRSPRWLAWLRG